MSTNSNGIRISEPCSPIAASFSGLRNKCEVNAELTRAHVSRHKIDLVVNANIAYTNRICLSSGASNGYDESPCLTQITSRISHLEQRLADCADRSSSADAATGQIMRP